MNRFLHLAIIGAALSGLASATTVTMTSASFVGANDLVVDLGATDDSTTRLVATYNGASVTTDLTTVGQEDRLPLGTLILGENIAAGDTTPNITAAEHDLGYGLTISANTSWGLLTFTADNSRFDITNFQPTPGVLDSDTTSGPPEILLNLAGLNQVVTLGNTTLQFSITNEEFGPNQTLAFHQGGTATTLFLRAEVLRVDQTSDAPEPASMAMMGAGLLGLGAFARRKVSVH